MNLTHQISPFDSSVNARLQRMGLLQDDSSPHAKAIAAFAHLHAALFFDDLFGCKAGTCKYPFANDSLVKRLLAATSQALRASS